MTHLYLIRHGQAVVNVFERDGRFLGTVTTAAMDVTHIGERTIAGVVSDEMGVQRVLVVPLRRG